MVLSAVTEASAPTSEAEASGSAGSGCGAVSAHLPLSWLRTIGSAPAFWRRISRNRSSGMDTILGLASAGAFSFCACFLFEYQMAPPSAAKRTTATSSPFGFIGYLRFHQVARSEEHTSELQSLR